MNKEQWQKKGVGHRQRLREKFLALGIESFSDEEVIELLLTLGTPRSDCKEAARAALKNFGSLPAVLNAPGDELRKIRGIGPKNVFGLHFIQGVARRYLKQDLVGKKYVTSSRQVADYLIHSMRDLEREVFSVVFLDSSHAIIDSKVLAEGTISVNTIYPREVVKAALQHNAAALIIAHNHPSGNLDPSEQDHRLTRHLYLACSFMHINLLDHFIIGKEQRVFSFADEGLMARIREKCESIIRG